jgi:hypothetical protein
LKAIEYANKYNEGLTSPDENKRNEAIDGLIMDFMDELKQIMEARHISKNSGAVAVIKELNQKWNAVNRKLSIPVLNEDGFKKIWLHKMPELEGQL